jgi:hypothetical protein
MSKSVPLLVVLGVFLIAAGAVYYGMRQPEPPPAPAPVAPRLPGVNPAGSGQAGVPAAPKGMKVEGAEIEQRDPQGQLEWKVTAGGQLEFDKDTQAVTGSDVQFEMVQQDRLPLIINAPVFQADYAGGHVTFSQGVRGHMSDGSAHFQVNHLVYDFRTRQLTGTGGAKFVQGKYTATADKIVLDGKSKKVRLTGGVKFTSRG